MKNTLLLEAKSVHQTGGTPRFILSPGDRYDTVGVAPLIKGLKFDALLGDQAYDSTWIVEEMNARGALICISQRPQRKAPLEIDPIMYGWRHLVENFFCDLKDFRRIPCDLTKQTQASRR